MNRAAEATRRVTLSFAASPDAAQALRSDLSAVAVAGTSLWLGGDEGTSVERLIRGREGYGAHRSFDLAAFFDLPDGPGEEIDVEGIAVDGPWLWVAGSHSATRQKLKPEQDETSAEAIRDLAEIRHRPNRDFLARVPFVEGADGCFDLAAAVEAADGTLRAACLPMSRKGNRLHKLLAQDPHFAPFMDLPAKENGFDIEGLAARGDRVFVGLRGPVVRGWAFVIEIEVKEAAPGELKMRRSGGDGRRYRKHVLGLDGLGIRDLHFWRDDLLILAGPVMDHDGPVRVYRWRGALATTEERIMARGAFEVLLELDHGRSEDKPEGIAILPGRRGAELLVVRDSPGKRRMVGRTAVEAEVYALPSF